MRSRNTPNVTLCNNLMDEIRQTMGKWKASESSSEKFSKSLWKISTNIENLLSHSFIFCCVEKFLLIHTSIYLKIMIKLFRGNWKPGGETFRLIVCLYCQQKRGTRRVKLIERGSSVTRLMYRKPFPFSSNITVSKNSPPAVPPLVAKVAYKESAAS